MLNYICNSCDPCPLHCEPRTADAPSIPTLLVPSDVPMFQCHPRCIQRLMMIVGKKFHLPWHAPLLWARKKWCIFIWETGIIVHFDLKSHGIWSYKLSLYEDVPKLVAAFRPPFRMSLARSPLSCWIPGPHNLQTLFGNQTLLNYFNKIWQIFLPRPHGWHGNSLGASP